MRRSLWLLVAACGAPAPAPAPATPSNVADPAVARPFKIDRADVADCSSLTVLHHATAGARTVQCGELAADAKPEQLAAALQCISDAVAHAQPFAFHQWVQGIDSQVGIGAFGRLNGGLLVVDELDYDSDPCGGGCPAKGHTDVVECSTWTRNGSASGSCSRIMTECFTCDGKRDVASCVQGGSAVSR